MHTKVRYGEIGARLCSIVLIACALVVAVPLGASAQGPPPWPPAPICDESPLGGQIILICTPPGPPTTAPWNGVLVVYAHGYVAPQMPLALPAGELGQIQLPGGAVGFLLSQGYAFATTSYSKNGWAVHAAEKDLNELVMYFKTKVLANAGLLEKVLIVGASEGGLITTLMVEKYPGIYGGGLAMCGPIGGMPVQVEYLADFRVVFDYFFPDVFPTFGVADVPEGAYLQWPMYQAAIFGSMASFPLKTGQVLSVIGALHGPVDLNPDFVALTTGQALYYSVVGTRDMIAAAGGMPYDNRRTYYGGPMIDPGLNDGVERVRGDGRAMAFVRRAYEPTGELERPLVTLHNVNDHAVPYWHEAMYAQTAWAGAPLVQYTSGVPYGHCLFSPSEVVQAFNTLVVMTTAMP